jgi:hypothetical protein
MGARSDNMRDPRQRQMRREGIRQRQEQIRQRQAQAEARYEARAQQVRAQDQEERRRLEEARRSESDPTRVAPISPSVPTGPTSRDDYFDREKFNKVANAIGASDFDTAMREANFDTAMREANQAGSIEELERISPSDYFDREKFNKVANAIGTSDFDTAMRKANQAGSIEELERMQREREMMQRAKAERADRMQRAKAERAGRMQRARAKRPGRMGARGTFLGPGMADRERDMSNYQSMIDRIDSIRRGLR